jgi:hypothetical protein
MKRRIAGIPVSGGLGRRAVKVLRGRKNSRQIRNALSRSPRRIVIGASATVGAILRTRLAEHVWEHLTAEETLGAV